MSNTEYSDEVLEVASEAGHILLENGAEISRVEDTMERISSHYGVNSGHFFRFEQWYIYDEFCQ